MTRTLACRLHTVSTHKACKRGSDPSRCILYVHVGPAAAPHNLPHCSNRKAWQELLHQPLEGRITASIAHSHRESSLSPPPQVQSPPPPPPPPPPSLSGDPSPQAQQDTMMDASAPEAHASIAAEAGASAAAASQPIAHALRPYLHAVLALDQVSCMLIMHAHSVELPSRMHTSGFGAVPSRVLLTRTPV